MNTKDTTRYLYGGPLKNGKHPRNVPVAMTTSGQLEYGEQDPDDPVEMEVRRRWKAKFANMNPQVTNTTSHFASTNSQLAGLLTQLGALPMGSSPASQGVHNNLMKQLGHPQSGPRK